MEHGSNNPPTKKLKSLQRKQLPLVVAGVVLVAIILFIGIHLHQPKRSIAAFCSVRQEEEAKLKNATGSTYSSALFPDRQSADASDFVDAMAKLEKVAPNDIVTDVHAQRLAFEKVAQDPTQSFSVALSAMASENNLRDWAGQHCGAQ